SNQPRASVTSPCRPCLGAPFFRRASRGWDRDTAAHSTGCREHQKVAQGRIAVQPKRFYPDDPIWRDGDMRSISPVAEFDLSKSYEFLNETFRETAQWHGAALNTNTLGEVPDSSW